MRQEGGLFFKRTPLQWGCEQEGEEEEGSQGLFFTWGSSEEAGVLLEVPAPSSTGSARLQTELRAAFCCGCMAGRKEHRAEARTGTELFTHR